MLEFCQCLCNYENVFLQKGNVVLAKEEKSVHQKVMEVVHAAEQLVKPPGSVPPPAADTKKDIKTTTIVMSKHVVQNPQTSTVSHKVF